MSYAAEFVRISLAHVLALVVPGPDFAIVLRQSLAHGRRAGILTALGIATGLTMHVTYSLFGIGILINRAPTAFIAVKWVGVTYLAWLGIQSIRASFATKGARLKRAEPAFAGKGEGASGASRPDAAPSLAEGFGVIEAQSLNAAAGAGPAERRLAATQASPSPANSGERSEARFYRAGLFTNALNPKVTLFFVAIFAALVSPLTPTAVRIGYGVWICLVTAIWFIAVAALFTHEPVRRGFLRLGPWIDRTMGVVFVGFAVLLGAANLR